MASMSDDGKPSPGGRPGFDVFPERSPLLANLREVVRLSGEFERHLGRELAVGQTDLTAMQHLIESGPLSPSELARRLHVSTAAVSLLVDRLESVGHVSRSPHPEDRRMIVVVPAAASVARTADELLPLVRAVSDLAAQLRPDELSVIERFLAGVVSAYEEALTTGPTSAHN